MSSRISSERKSSSESSLNECQIPPQSPLSQNCRKNKSPFKSRVFCKRLKTKHEVSKSSKNMEKSVSNVFDENENTLRRSKRRKHCDLNVQPGKSAQTNAKPNFKSDIKETEDENLRQHLSFNFIPENVKKSLDNELFPEESDEDQDLNIKGLEAMSEKKQLAIDLKDTNEPITVDNTFQQSVNLDDDKTLTRKSSCDTRSLPNFPYIFDEMISDDDNNQNKINTEKEVGGRDSLIDATNEIYFHIEGKGKCERNNKAKGIINDEIINDPSLNVLQINIKKSGDIINSLVESVDANDNYSVRKKNKHTSYSKPRLSDNNSVDDVFYVKQNKNISDTNARKNFDIIKENSSESEPSTSRKNDQPLSHDQHEYSLENMNHMENKQNETIDETSKCNGNLASKEERNGVEYDLLRSTDSNHFDVNSIISENSNALTKPECNASSAKSNKQILPKSELNTFSMETDNSHENNEFHNSQRSKKAMQKFHLEANNRNNTTDGTNNSVETSEMNQHKLALLYMSALDYEKEIEENGLEINKKGNETESGNFDSNVGDESIDNHTFVTQKDIEMSKQDLDALQKKIAHKEMKNVPEIQIYQNIKHNGVLNEKGKLKEDDTQKNVEEKKKDIHDSQKSRQETFDTYTNEHYNSKYQSLLKYGVTYYEDSIKMSDSEEHFTTMQDHANNISLSRTSSNSPIHNDEANVVVDVEDEKIEEWYKTKCIPQKDTTFVVTATGGFKLEHNGNSTEMVNDRKDENTENLKGDVLSHEDVNESFDMDDDFDLTASQMNMIEMNENNLCKKPSKIKPCTKIESCNDTHFQQDSTMVEILDQLFYIRKSVDFIKESLTTFMLKNDDKK